MKKSIKRKLFWSISGLILFFVLFSWLLNTQYLDRYYLSQKEDRLTASAAAINRVYHGNLQTISLELEKVERTTAINVMIMNSSYQQKYPAGSRFFGAPAPDRWLERPKMLVTYIRANLPELKQGKSLSITVSDPRMNSNFLYMVSLLDNGDFLLLSTPLAAIKESAAIANRFFLFTGLLTIIIGSILIFFFSKQFTRPFIELNEIAQGMARLDFSRKYPVKTDDEIGELGKSINCLSDQLDRSISGLREANEKLQADIEKERKIDEMRKEFVSSVSHELKTPIALIQGYAEGLKENVVIDEENKSYYCHVIIDEAAKMNKLVRDLLDLSRVESGFFQLEKSTFEICGLVENTLEKFAPVFAEKDVHPQLSKEETAAVEGDVVRIEQVLVNFLNNALQHLDGKKELKISIADLGNKVRISVTNSGSPIPEDSLDKIWTSFYKADKARTRSAGGTGLGLSIVRAIQELHHNGYGVRNLDRGVEFWFEVDKAEA